MIGSIIGLIKPISQLQISSTVFDAQNRGIYIWLMSRIYYNKSFITYQDINLLSIVDL